MRSAQRSDIKNIIEEFRRQAIDLQLYRGTLIRQIQEHPSYQVPPILLLLTLSPTHIHHRQTS